MDTAWRYRYDKKNQLIGAVADNSDGKQVFKYGFDSIGNRLSYSTALSKETYKYNDLNQLTNQRYKYDKFGNLVKTPDATYKYNLNNRLVEIRQKDSRLTFAYDGNGRRTDKKVFNSKGELVSRTQFLYSGFKCVAEIDALNNKVTRFYSWQGEQLLGVVDTKSGKQLACLTDGNKNVVGLLDGSGEVSAKYAYSPFGKLISAKGADAQKCGFGFSSEYRDNESGLVYYNYRYLNTKLGRWMTRDPIEENGGWNTYVMLENDIANFVDLLGCAKIKYYTNKKVDVPYYRLTLPNGLGAGEWGVSQVSNGKYDYKILSRDTEHSTSPDASCHKPACTRHTYKITLKIKFFIKGYTIGLPKWLQYAAGTPEQQNAWNKMIAALKVHELGHVAIWEKYNGLEEIFDSASDCSKTTALKNAKKAINDKFSSEYNKRVDKTKKAQTTYDKKTQHGFTQGVFLPQI